MADDDKELTPKNMLREYQRQADDESRKQVELFKAMSPSEQRELLFYLIINLSKALQYLHSLVDSEEAETTDFADIKTETQ